MKKELRYIAAGLIVAIKGIRSWAGLFLFTQMACTITMIGGSGAWQKVGLLGSLVCAISFFTWFIGAILYLLGREAIGD